jgi:hypothetical protein
MKSPKTAIILVIIAMFFVGCSKNMDYPDPIAETLTSGNFTVNYFFESQDKTSSYTGYVFEFENDGSLNCISANGDFQGTWKQLNKVDGPAINITLTAPDADLQNLNRDWAIVDADNAKLSLKNSTATFVLRK